MHSRETVECMASIGFLLHLFCHRLSFCQFQSRFIIRAHPPPPPFAPQSPLPHCTAHRVYYTASSGLRGSPPPAPPTALYSGMRWCHDPPPMQERKRWANKAAWWIFARGETSTETANCQGSRNI